MKIQVFDRISGALIVLSWGYTIIVAATQWNWFPAKGDWGHIAEVPPTLMNYVALLLPWVMMLIYLVARRRYFKKPNEESYE